VQATPALTFMVGQLGSGGTITTASIGQTSDRAVTDVSTISITNGTATAYSITELDHTVSSYYDAYTTAGLYEEGNLVQSAASNVEYQCPLRGWWKPLAFSLVTF
jgi:hypothetical protein